jgi:hypothetical protein
VFIAITQILTVTSEFALNLTTRNSDTVAKMFYLIDYFQSFFSLLLFVSVDLGDPNFWGMLVVDCVNLIIGETVGYVKFIKLVMQTIGALKKPEEEDFEDAEMRVKLVGSRRVIKAAVHDLVQVHLCGLRQIYGAAIDY